MTLTALPTGRAERRPDNTAVIAEWSGWLRERLDHQWRLGEWDASLLLFTGDPNNPRTGVGVCPVAGCGATFSSLSASYCVLCTNAYRRSGMKEEEFENTYTRHNRRLNVYRRVASCAVPVCVRDPFALSLCRTHYRSWVKARNRPGIDQSAWMATLRPLGEAE